MFSTVNNINIGETWLWNFCLNETSSLFSSKPSASDSPKIATWISLLFTKIMLTEICAVYASDNRSRQFSLFKASLRAGPASALFFLLFFNLLLIILAWQANRPSSVRRISPIRKLYSPKVDSKHVFYPFVVPGRGGDLYNTYSLSKEIDEDTI